MNPKRILLLALIAGPGSGLSAQTEPAQDFKSVFQTISAKNALSMSFREHMTKLRPLCTERDKTDPDYDRKGTVKCLSKTEVSGLDMVGTATPAVTMISATIAGVDKCGYMRSVLIQQYGKPDKSEGNCNSEWLVKRGNAKPLVHVGLEADIKDDTVYFSNQEEQGP